MRLETVCSGRIWGRHPLDSECGDALLDSEEIVALLLTESTLAWLSVLAWLLTLCARFLPSLSLRGVVRGGSLLEFAVSVCNETGFNASVLGAIVSTEWEVLLLDAGLGDVLGTVCGDVLGAVLGGELGVVLSILGSVYVSIFCWLW